MAGKVGRPKGSLSQKTMERMAAKRHLVARIVKSTDQLFNAQLDKAVGEKFLFVKITERDEKGRVTRIYHEAVTDPNKIVEYLDGELEGAESINDTEKDRFYYLTTRAADNLAIQNLLDRAYGKPTEKVELGGADEGDLSELSDEELDERIQRYIDRRRTQ